MKSYQEMVYCSGSTLGIVPLDNSPLSLVALRDFDRS